jgi:hypothetical protein
MSKCITLTSDFLKTQAEGLLTRLRECSEKVNGEVYSFLSQSQIINHINVEFQKSSRFHKMSCVEVDYSSSSSFW